MDILVPIFICVVLPVSIVGIVFAASMYSDNKRSKVLIKAIENGGIDSDKLAEALNKPRKSPREILNLRLLRGCLFALTGLALCICSGVEFSSFFGSDLVVLGGVLFAIGLSYLIVYFVTRKQHKA